MRKKLAVTLSFLGATLALWVPAPASAQANAGRFLEGIEVDETPDSLDVRIVFTSSVRYVRHAPHASSETLHIQLAPAGVTGWDERPTESLRAARSDRSPLELVIVEFEGSGATLELRFAKRVAFEVEPGRDSRSVLVRLPIESVAPPAQARGAGSSDTGEPDPRVAELMDEGRKAFTTGEFQRAALIFGEAARGPEGPQSPEAHELLGLARERTGQLAHAKAEYEEYLRRYPADDGADRVRQRLAALTTSHAVPKGPLRARPEARPRLDLQTFGSLYVGFRRESLFTGGEEILVDNSLLTDVHLDTRLRRRGFTLRSQLAASYWHGFLDRGSEGRARIYSAFLEAGNPTDGLAGSIGRRNASERGVIGRYDGIQLSHTIGERWSVGAIAGFPLDTPGIDDFDATRYLAGVNGSVRDIADAVDANFFAISQMDDGLVDRAALGGEFRYFSEGRMLSAFLDFDAYFVSLNVAQLIGSWQVHPRVFLTGTLDYRNVPILTTSNALIGQPASDLDALQEFFSEREIKKLAKDRTGRAGTLSLNASYQLTPSLQLAGDFIASHMSGTETSGGVEGWRGNGFEFAYVARLVANELLAAGDVGVVTFRYFDGSNTDLIAATLDARYPITPNLRLNPRLWTDFRIADVGSNVFRLVPSLRGDWRVLAFELESEVGFEWLQPIGGLNERQLGYFVSFGVRYDF